MQSKFILVLFILSIAFCSEEEEYSKLHKYREACSGYVSDASTPFRQFIDTVLDKEKETIVQLCEPEYFTTIPETCSEEHKKCVVRLYCFCRKG